MEGINMSRPAPSKARFGAISITYTLVVIGILVGVNYVAKQFNKSYDATAEKRFTLSDQTEKIVKGLKQPVELLYFGGGGTASFKPAKDLLDPYAELSKNVKVRMIDMEQDPVTPRKYGVRAPGSLIAAIGERQEESQALSEDEVTGALVRLTKGKARVVCFQQGFGEGGLEEASTSGLSNIVQLLRSNNYEAKAVNLLDTAKVSDDCRILALMGPRNEIPAGVVDAIKSYVEAGGRLYVSLGPPLQLKADKVAPNDALTNLLGKWGVGLERNLVIDQSQGGRLMGLGPLTPLVAKIEQHPILRPYQGRRVLMIAPVSQSLTIKSGGKVQVQPLFATSASSVSTKQLAAAEIEVKEGDPKGPFTLAAAGTFNTGNAEKEGRFVVNGSADFASNQIPRGISNYDVFLNMMNWLSQDEDLISIRPKDPQERRLDMSAGQTNLVFFSSVIFLPLMAALAGLSAWWRRR
jgi:ABC-type uncharacterized transport system involved in gliding motility auxiliary subunit